MRFDNSHSTPYGTIKLSLEALGGLEQELGADGFAMWIEHQVNVAVKAVVTTLSPAVRELTSGAEPYTGQSAYKESIKLTYKGTAVKVGLKLRLNVTLDDQQLAYLAGALLADVREHLLEHMEDKVKAEALMRLAETIQSMMAGMALSAMFAGGGNPFADDPGLSDLLGESLADTTVGGLPFAGLFGGGGFRVDGLGSAEAMPSSPFDQNWLNNRQYPGFGD